MQMKAAAAEMERLQQLAAVRGAGSSLASFAEEEEEEEEEEAVKKVEVQGDSLQSQMAVLQLQLKLQELERRVGAVACARSCPSTL
jgi:homoserine kinase